jgi:hypothetical protein
MKIDGQYPETQTMANNGGSIINNRLMEES